MGERLTKQYSRISELEAANNALNIKIRDLQNLRENEHACHTESLAGLKAELACSQDKLLQQSQKYEDYRRMIESEEARLNIIPLPIQSTNTSIVTPSRSMSLRDGKRKRILLKSQECNSNDYRVIATNIKGDVEIAEVHPLGRFVKLRNKSSEEIRLSSWQLIHKAGAFKTIFKFHHNLKLKGGAKVFVWSAERPIKHKPPENIVMQNQKWFIANNMTTTLINNEGKEMATFERKRQRLSISLSRLRKIE